jgi:hypothetical protein
MKSLIGAVAIAVIAGGADAQTAPTAASGSQSAPVTVRPGDERITPQAIAPRTDTFTIVTRRREGTTTSVHTSTVVRSIDRTRMGSNDALVYAQRYVSRQLTVDTSWLDAGTLRPIEYRARLGQEAQRVTFGSPITGTVQRADSAPRSIVHPATEPVFNAVAAELVLMAMALRPGERLSFAAFNPPSYPLRSVVTVVGADSVTMRNGQTRRALLVIFDAGLPTKMWLDADSRSLLLLGGGSTGNAFWKARSDVAIPGDP